MRNTTSSLSRNRLSAGLAVVAVGLAAACSGGDSDASPTSSGGEAVDPVEIAIAPEDGAEEVRPDLPVTITAEGGTLTEVAVSANGSTATTAVESGEPEISHASTEEGEPSDLDAVTGVFSEDATEWTSEWTLPPGTEVTVTAAAEKGDGSTAEATSVFTTTAGEGEPLGLTSNFPVSGNTVGVGMPIILDFDRPVHNKAQVEEAIEVVSEEPTQGAFNWFGDQKAVFRAEEYWEPYQEITVNLRLAGVRFGQDMYGGSNYQINFEVGRELISEMHVPDHEMVVNIDGEEARTIPVSNGKATSDFNTTTSGVHLTMEKYSNIVMDSATVGIPEGDPDYYYLDVDWAVRTTNSGMFTHAADYHANHGERDVSNGCTNMLPDDAKWFYDNSLLGDPLITTGTDRELKVDNGWGYYQRSWEEWLEHSELGEPHQTDGSGAPEAPSLEAEDAEEEPVGA